MPIIAEVLDYRDELIAIRRDIHAHPELAFAEQRTSDLVAVKLSEYGCEVYRGLAGTGVVGTMTAIPRCCSALPSISRQPGISKAPCT